MELKPVRLTYTDTLFNFVIQEFAVPQRFACYNCGKHKRSKRFLVGTDPAGQDVRICLSCSEAYRRHQAA